MINHMKRLGILCIPQISIEPPTKSQKRGTVSTSEKTPHNQHVPHRNLSSILLIL